MRIHLAVPLSAPQPHPPHPLPFPSLSRAKPMHTWLRENGTTCPLAFSLVLYFGVQNDYVLGFIICEIFTVIALQDWVGWGIFTVIAGYPRRANGDSQHLEAPPELQDCLRFELFTVKNYRTGPFSKLLGNSFELYSSHSCQS